MALHAPLRKDLRDDRAFHRRGTRRARPHHCSRARSHRALRRSVSMPARSSRKNCSPIARPMPASSIRRLWRSMRSLPNFRALMRRERMSRGCIRAISAYGAPWASNCANSIVSASPIRSRPACRALPPPPRRCKRELTLPEVAQSLVLTRTGGRASAMPAKGDACDLRRERRDTRDPSVDPCDRENRRRASALLRRGLSRGRRLSRLLAG